MSGKQIFSRTHFVEVNSSGSESEGWKLMYLKSILMRVFLVFADVAFNLFSADHSIKLEKALLFWLDILREVLE